VDSCFALLGARQHCVAKICNASPKANAHKLQNDPCTISSSVLWTHSIGSCHVGVSKRFSLSISLAVYCSLMSLEFYLNGSRKSRFLLPCSITSRCSEKEPALFRLLPPNQEQYVDQAAEVEPIFFPGRDAPILPLANTCHSQSTLEASKLRL